MQLEAGALSVGVAGASLPAPRRAWRRTRVLLASGGARIGAAILLLVAVCAIAPGWLAPADPNEQNLLARFTRPASRSADGTLAVLGTDQLGRDILSRVVHGAKTSVLIGLSAVLVAGAVGTGLGLVAGMRGGPWDHAIMRLADMQFAFPFILLAITVMEVSVFYVPALARVLVPVLLILSTLKFSLVAMFYMHLRFDHPWFSYVFVGPLIIAIGLAVAMLWLFGHIGTTGVPPAGAG